MGKLYLLWALVALGLAFAQPGHSLDHATRVLLLLFVGLQLAAAPALRRALARWQPRTRFVLCAMFLAALVEGLYMFTRPAFACLQVTRETPALRALNYYLSDLALTWPAYFVIFLVIWRQLNRYRYSFWEYALVMGMGQALGDGFVFFVSAPVMVAFLPYQMLNYHAMNILPYLVVRDDLDPQASRSARRFLALPLLVAVYLACGAMIAFVGPRLGLH